MNIFVNVCSWHFLEKINYYFGPDPSYQCEQQAPVGSSRVWEAVAALLTFGSRKKQWARSAALQMWTCLEAEWAEISCWWETPSHLQLLHYPSEPSVTAQLLGCLQPKVSHFLRSPFELWVWTAFHFVLSLVVFETRIWFLLCQLSVPLVSLSLQFFLDANTRGACSASSASRGFDSAALSWRCTGMCQRAVVHVSQQKNILARLAQAAELLLLLNVILGSWLMRVVTMGSVGCSGLFWDQDFISLAIISWIKTEDV